MSDSSSNLKSKLLHGSAWMISSQWVLRFIGLISTMVTARLLTPQDFGIVAILASVVAAIDSFLDFGFDLALLKDKEASQEDYNAAWSMRILRSVLFSILILILSPLISQYSHTPDIISIAYVISGSIFIRGFYNIGTIDFQKNFKFNLLFQLRCYPKIVGAISTIILAILLRNYWALVFGTLLSALAGVFLSFYLSEFKPKFIWTGYPKIWSYSKWILLLNFARQNFRNIDKLVFSGFIGKEILGFYSVSAELTNMLTTEWIEPVVTVLRAGYAQIQDDSKELRRTFLLTLSIYLSALIPAAVGVWLLASDIVAVILGSQWQNAVVFVSLFAWLSILGSLSNFITSFMSMVGLVKMASNIVFFRVFTFFILFYFVFLSYGLLGVIYLKIVLIFTELIILITTIGRHIKISFISFFSLCWRPALSSLCMAKIVLLISDKLNFSIIVNLFIQVGVGASVYIFASMFLWILSKKPNGIERQVINIIYPRVFPTKNK